MTPIHNEYLTKQFYAWERRGRGWDVFNSLVDIEPPYTHFSFDTKRTITHDDGIARSKFWEAIKATFLPTPEVEPIKEDYKLTPLEYEPEGGLTVFNITIPKGYNCDELQAEQFLLMLSGSKQPLSFEVIATHLSIIIQFVCREQDSYIIQSQIKAYLPECIIERHTNFQSIIASDKNTAIIDLGLKEEFMRPLTMASKFSVDPLIGLFGLMEHLNPGEQAAIQILFIGAIDPWPESIMNSVTDNNGESFFSDAPEMPKMAQKKIGSPLYGVTIRAIGQSAHAQQAKIMATNLANVLCHVSHSEGNALIQLSNKDYNSDEHVNDVLMRQSHRLGMLLNCKEVVTFIHIPSASVVSTKIQRDAKKTKVLPAVALNGSYILGTNIHQGQSFTASLAEEQRLRHMHVIGATGTGKTTLLQKLITQDVEQGKGLAVLDPHGDLIESLLAGIPANRINDVVLVDPADALFPIGFNILRANSEVEKDVLSSDLVAVFKRLSTSWGDQMNSVFANAILAFLESDKGGTLIDLRRFLVEPSFREAHLKTVTDVSIVYYWRKEYPLVKSASIGPILTRLDTFLRPKLVRNMVAQNKGLDFENILNSGKILLVKLSQGLIGDENSYLLGTLVVSKIYQAAMARQAQGKQARQDFFLYVDEFQNFITPSMSQILSGARKYHLGLILAHQDMQQLAKENAELASSVTANAGTRVCFRLGDTDAKRFEDGFSFFEAKDLQNLERGQAIVRIDRPEYDFNLSISPVQENTDDNEETRQRIIEQVRKRYATPRQEVEASLDYLRASIEPEPEPREELVKPVKKKAEQTELQEKVEPQSIELKQPVVEVPNLEEQKKEETIDRVIKQKEQSQHRYLQTLIKKMAEARGYIARIEEPVENGKVDVSLEKKGKKIAVEIGITTSKKWEVHNVEKCLAAGYDLVVAIATDEKAQSVMQKLVEKSLTASLRVKVLVMQPEEFFQHLSKEVAKESSTEKTVKGYRVKVEYEVGDADETKAKMDSVMKTVMNSKKKKI